MPLHPRHSQILAALTDSQAVAMTIWAEARAELVEGEIAVGCVIRNRLLRPRRFSNEWKGVVHQRNAKGTYEFSCWMPSGGAKNYNQLMAVCEAALAGERLWPVQQQWIAEGIIAGYIEDRVAGADHYYADYIPAPSWWPKMIETAHIGVHIFGRERL